MEVRSILFIVAGTAFFLTNCKPRLQSDRNNADGKVYQLRINPAAGSKYQFQMSNGSKVNMTVDAKAIETTKKGDVTVSYAVEIRRRNKSL